MIEVLIAADRALAEGRLDQAERLFSGVATADERNAIAIVGLARVAAARGDRGAAAEYARRALTIDPDDAEATRILANALAPVDSTAAAPRARAPGRARKPSTARRLLAGIARALDRGRAR